jgi:hypothetical protein
MNGPDTSPSELYAHLTRRGIHSPERHTSEWLYKVAQELAERSKEIDSENCDGLGI